MTNKELIQRYRAHPALSEVCDFLHSHPTGRAHLHGLLGSGAMLLASAAVRASEGVHLFVFTDKEEAAYAYNDLQNLLDPEKVMLFPVPFKHSRDEAVQDNANVLMRAETLDLLLKRPSWMVIVSYAEALSVPIASRRSLKKHVVELHVGQSYDLSFINEFLQEFHFERTDFVTRPGEFAIRGGILDVFSYAADMPYRMEFFGDELESIRQFDVGTQLSVKTFRKVNIIPNVEDLDTVETRERLDAMLPAHSHLWFKDAELSLQRLGPARREEFEAGMHNFRVIEFGSQSVLQPQYSRRFNHQTHPFFRKNFELLSAFLHEQHAAGVLSVVTFSQGKQMERLHTIMQDIDPDAGFTSLMLPLHEGFIDDDLKLAVLTDHQIFERYHRFRLKEGYHRAQQALTIKDLMSLKKGDFVTHIDYGVGRFDGLQKVDNNGKIQEALRLVYKDNDILYVSIHSLHRIARFSGSEGMPKLNKLGSGAWKALKNKTKSRVKELAFDLIKLYAQRKASKGFAFSPDTYLQTELESSFIYEDTPDQLKATVDVKEDMEKPWPMDRLICGDVGFGKTEIAIRAAFKAVADSKQVAVLVPTTILSMQHFKTFSDRLRDMPCKIGVLNRFKSAAQTKETLLALKEGRIDIIIGTHRLISKDIKFKDLGLLIIDEEQKFGVNAKDKLKTFRANVDTLTLTATPIPRTLQFSMMSARDLSVINTPPPNRQPVETRLVSFNEAMIKDAINYEVAREGQVFLVHNRVDNIHEIAVLVRKLCPEVRVAVAHGQMDGKHLEEVMYDFMEQDYDVLIATTIIESGLDIPNANTIIINNAHHFGLSDLHQMRGRVGRSNRKAFCYLMSPPMSSLPDDSRKRLQAIEQFSDLGSGLNIAMRDLDIRGAGDLLGAEQSGFISDIGFETYQKILNEAIRELKDKEFKEVFADEKKKEAVADCQLDTDLAIMIPDTYVSSINERLLLYQKLGELENEAELKQFSDELHDRFGPAPAALDALLNAVRLQWRGKACGIDKIVLKQEKLVLDFGPDPNSDFYNSEVFGQLIGRIQQMGNRARLKQQDDRLRIVVSHVLQIEEVLHLLEMA
jgi:transcription-repair coupling factor (superfamily II helicase)